MDHRRLVFAWLVALGASGGAAATGVDVRDMTAVQHATIDSGSRDGSGGAMTGRDPAPSSSNNAPTASDENEDGISRPQDGRHGSLGWQSLLPGSIQ